jgi:hypothetical protein
MYDQEALHMSSKWFMAAALVAGSLEASPINGLFNTGVDNAGVVLNNPTPGDNSNGLTEMHWLQGGNLAMTYTASVDFPGTYLANTAASMWISNPPTATGGGIIPYTLSFLMPASFASATISGRWASDNCGTGTLNGNLFSTIANCTSASSFQTWTPFSISTSAFIGGTNTFQFNQENTGTGLRAIRIEFLSSDVNTAQTPEPTTVATTGLALVALGLARRRKRKGAA